MTDIYQTVTLETGPAGMTVMVEPPLRKGLTRRVFRYMPDGSLECASYDDWQAMHERARFFGYASRELPTSMTSQPEQLANAGIVIRGAGQ